MAISAPDGSKRSRERRLKRLAVWLLLLLVPSTSLTCCYAPIPPTVTPSPPFTSPVSPLSPPPTPTPTVESRGQLRQRLVAENRLPGRIVKEMEL